MTGRLREGYRALVIGASGAIGEAFVQALRADARCAEVLAVTRAHPWPWDLRDADSIATLAGRVNGPLHLVVDATGALTIDGRGPEKRLQELDAAALLANLQVNAVGPALLLRHLSPLLARDERVLWAKLSARVGSIEDNRKGGWYGYRAAKAALNQLLQTAAIELARQRPLAVVAALQPGTVRSSLSQPFVGEQATTPALAVQGLLQALDQLEPTGRAHFIDYAGQSIPW
ncbi:MAG: SDR family NAD(P)-dependent oxidoreductase [Hylemonella sp.]|uniref:SDR family NAD(P)-dependent oxidoreductase n=1 Tax=Hylemonella sp. TaxID=2066020 RepID=UPI0022C36888|nr:SDR family NAD(P)-dependent oxidoreductase [Hylemonella sp.]MCZ8253192.1 SDR family NAD(P)-dependent oxidoreductase [Hylemonella sp.]